MVKNVVCAFLVFLFFLLLIKCEYSAEEKKEITFIGGPILKESETLLDRKEEGKYEHNNGVDPIERTRMDSDSTKKSKYRKSSKSNKVISSIEENKISVDYTENSGIVGKYAKGDESAELETLEQEVLEQDLIKETQEDTESESFEEVVNKRHERNVYSTENIPKILDAFEILYDQEVKKHVEHVDEIFLRIMHKKNCNFLEVLDEYSLRCNIGSALYTTLKYLIKQISSSKTVMFADRRNDLGVFRMLYKNNMKEEVFKKHFLLSLFRWYNIFKLTKIHFDNVNYVFYLNDGQIYSHKYVYKILMDFLNSENFLFYVNLNKFPFLEILKYYNKYNFQINNKIRNDYPVDMYTSETFNNFIYTYFLTYNNKIFERHRYLIEEEEWRHKGTFVERSNEILFQKVKNLNKNIILYSLGGSPRPLQDCVKNEMELLILTFMQLAQETLNFVYNVFIDEKISFEKGYSSISQKEEIYNKGIKNQWVPSVEGDLGEQEIEKIEKVERKTEVVTETVSETATETATETTLETSTETSTETATGEMEMEIKTEEEIETETKTRNESYNTLKHMENELLNKLKETYNATEKDGNFNKLNSYILNNFNKVFNFYSQRKNLFENYKNRYELENGYIVNNISMKKMALLFDPIRNIFNELSQMNNNRNVNFEQIYEYLMTIIKFEDEKNFYDGRLKCGISIFSKNQKPIKEEETLGVEEMTADTRIVINSMNTENNFIKNNVNVTDTKRTFLSEEQRDMYNDIDLNHYTPAAVSMKDRIYDQLKLLKHKYVDMLQNEGKCMLAFLYLIGVNDNEGRLKFPYGFPRNIDKAIDYIKKGNAGLCNFLSGFLFHINLPVFVNNTNVWLTTEMNDEEFSETKQNSVNNFFYIYHKQKEGLKVPPFLSNESRLFSNKTDVTKSKIISYALGSTKDDMFSKLAFTNNILRLKEKNKASFYFREFLDFTFDNESLETNEMTVKSLSPFLTSCNFLLNNIATTTVESLKTSNILENSVYREEISENSKNLIENSNDHTKSLFEYFLKLADNRNSYALAALGEIYFLGNENIGIERDEQKAFEYWKKAADQGDSISALSTGYAYLDDYKRFAKQEELIKGMTPEQLKRFVEEEMEKKGKGKDAKKKEKFKKKNKNKWQGQKQKQKQKKKDGKDKDKVKEKENGKNNEKVQPNQQVEEHVLNSNSFFSSNIGENTSNTDELGKQNISDANNLGQFNFTTNDKMANSGWEMGNAFQETHIPANGVENPPTNVPITEEQRNVNENGETTSNVNMRVNESIINNKDNNVETKNSATSEMEGEEERENEEEEDEVVNDYLSNLNEETTKALKNAEHYFHKAIKHNDDSLESVLAKYNIYKFGLGKEKNIELAGYYLKRAADKGDNIAQMLLGHYYAGTDIGVIINDKEETKVENLSKSYKYYEMSAQGGNLISLYNQSVLILKGVSPEFKTFHKKCQKTLKHFHFITLFNDRIALLTKLLKRNYEMNDYVGSLLLAMMLTELGEHSNNVNASFLWKLKKNTMNNFLKKHNIVEALLKKFKAQVSKDKEMEKEDLMPLKNGYDSSKENIDNSEFTGTKYLQKTHEIKKKKGLFVTRLLRNCVNLYCRKGVFFWIKYCNYLKKEFLQAWMSKLLNTSNVEKIDLKQNKDNDDRIPSGWKNSNNLGTHKNRSNNNRNNNNHNRINNNNNNNNSIDETEEPEYHAQEFVNSFKQIELYEKYDRIIFSEISKEKENNVVKKIKIIEKVKDILFEHFRKTEFLHCYYRPISYYQVKYQQDKARTKAEMIQRKEAGNQATDERGEKEDGFFNGKNEKEKENVYSNGNNGKHRTHMLYYSSPQEMMLSQSREAEFINYAMLLENDDMQEIFYYQQKYDVSMFEEIQSFSKNCDVCKHYYDIYSSYYGYNKALMELVKKYNKGDYFTVKSKRKELQYLLKNSYLGNHESLFYMALFFEYNKVDHLKNVLQIYMGLATDKHDVCNVVGVLGILKIFFKKLFIDMNNMFEKSKNLKVDDDLKQYVLFKTCPRETNILKKRKIDEQCINYKAFLNDRFMYSELSYWDILRVLKKWFLSFFKGG